MTRTTGGIVLVGLDNTPAARAALRWAVRRAAQVGGVVRAMYAFELPGTAAARLEPDLAGARRAAQERAQAWVSDGLSGLDRTAPVVEIRDGDAATVLARAARTADVLVVGDNRGRASEHPLLDRCVVPPGCEVVVVDEAGRVNRPARELQETS